MKASGYLWVAALVAAAVSGAYALTFKSHQISSDPRDWAVFGDYFGGVLSAGLSFLTVVLLARSLEAQKEANRTLKDEAIASARESRLRTFEGLFFELLRSMRQAFESLEVVQEKKSQARLNGSAAVREIEAHIAGVIEGEAQSDCLVSIKKYLETLDEQDGLYSCLRSFSSVARLIPEVLTECAGFSVEDRRKYYRLLINISDFSNLRLAIILMQFSELPHAKILREQHELIAEMKAFKLLKFQYPSGRKIGGRGRVKF